MKKFVAISPCSYVIGFACYSYIFKNYRIQRKIIVICDPLKNFRSIQEKIVPIWQTSVSRCFKAVGLHPGVVGLSPQILDMGLNLGKVNNLWHNDTITISPLAYYYHGSKASPSPINWIWYQTLKSPNEISPLCPKKSRDLWALLPIILQPTFPYKISIVLVRDIVRLRKWWWWWRLCVNELWRKINEGVKKLLDLVNYLALIVTSLFLSLFLNPYIAEETNEVLKRVGRL